MKGDLPRELSQWMKIQEETSEINTASVDLSVIVPAYNEYLRLPSALMEMIDYLDRAVQNEALTSYEIVVVDDGSRDRTSDIVTKFERIRPQVRLIRLPVNSGKGHAVRLGVLNSRGVTVLFADADGATPFNEYEKLKAALTEGYDVAVGSRAAYSKDTKVKTLWYRKAMGRIFNLAVNLFILPDIADTQCGFKMMHSSAAHFLFAKQKSSRFSFDVEILYIARRVALKVKEVPVNWTNVPGSKVNLIMDSLRMFRDIFVFYFRHRRLTPSDFPAKAALKS